MNLLLLTAECIELFAPESRVVCEAITFSTVSLYLSIENSLLLAKKNQLIQVIQQKSMAIGTAMREKLDIITSFSSIYSAAWYISLIDNSIFTINVSSNLEDPTQSYFFSGKQNLRTVWTDFCSNLASTEDQKRVSDFFDLTTLQKRLYGQKELTLNFAQKNGEFSQLEIIPAQYDANKNPTHVILAMKDITQETKETLKTQSALQEAFLSAKRANNAKTDFLSRMSHDIRTPLNAIIGMTVIAGTHIDDKMRIVDCLSKITSSSRHLLSLINNVLDMSKIESGNMKLNETDFNLATLVDSLMQICQPSISSRKHDVSVLIKDVQHEDVIGDNLRLQQVFVNLMSNAIKYTPSGGKITLTIKEKNCNNPLLGFYEFIIEDTGIGMPPEFLQNIFEPFSRVEDNRTNKVQGTGLGMAITNTIVQMMGGTIQVESELNKGSRFTVSVTLKLQNTSPQKCEALAGLRVLVVDDEQMICENTSNILDTIGMRSEWCLTGQEAVKKVVAAHDTVDNYFCVIIDWKMPNMDGLATIKAIRKEVGSLVPIIVFSAYDWTDIEDEAIEAGVDFFISKPLFKSKLTYLFQSIVQKKYNKNDTQEQSSDFSGYRILLVEDNELNMEIACEILGMFHLNVDTAENGQVAVNKFSASSENYYDLILMDIQMNTMNGYEATRQIRAMKRTDSKKIPIIALTADAFLDDVEKSKQSGMNDHLSKPISMELLMNCLTHWLKERSN
jgi:signal transduction histidine kinase/CheY-like chemotaxis protein